MRCRLLILARGASLDAVPGHGLARTGSVVAIATRVRCLLTFGCSPRAYDSWLLVGVQLGSMGRCRLQYMRARIFGGAAVGVSADSA